MLRPSIPRYLQSNFFEIPLSSSHGSTSSSCLVQPGPKTQGSIPKVIHVWRSMAQGRITSCILLISIRDRSLFMTGGALRKTAFYGKIMTGPLGDWHTSFYRPILYKKYSISEPYLIAQNESITGPCVSHLTKEVMRPCMAFGTQQHVLDMHTIIRYRKSLYIKYPPGLYKSCQTMSYGYGLNMEASAHTLIRDKLHEHEYYMLCGLRVFFAV